MLKIFGNKAEGYSASHEETGEYLDLLLDCPFCGERDDLDIVNTHTPSYNIECNNCGGTMVGGNPNGYWGQPIRTTTRCAGLHAAAIEKAVERWNTRAAAKPTEPTQGGAA